MRLDYFLRDGHPVLLRDGKEQELYPLLKRRRFSYMGELLRLSKRRIAGRSLQERLSSEGQTLWHLFDYSLLWSSSCLDPAEPGLDYLLLHIDLLTRLPAQDIELHCDRNAGMATAILEQLCRERGRCLRVIEDREGEAPRTRLRDRPGLLGALLPPLLAARILVKWLRALLGLPGKPVPGCALFLSNIRFEGRRPEEQQLFGSILRALRMPWRSVVHTPLSLFPRPGILLRRGLLRRGPYLADYSTLAGLREGFRLARQLRGEWRQVRRTKGLRDACTYKGINYYGLLEPRLDRLLGPFALAVADAMVTARGLLERERPRTLVLDHENGFLAKAALLNAKLLGRPLRTVALQYELVYPGCVHTYPKDREARRKASPLWRPLPDVKCVWGDYARKILREECNYPSGRIAVTGNPKFDPLLRRGGDAKKDCAKRTGGAFRVLVAPVPAMAALLEEAAPRLPAAEFLIKPKGGTPIAPYRRLADGQANVRLLPAESDLYRLIGEADAVLVTTSTVGFEAMLLGRSLLVYRPGEPEGGLPYEEGALIVKDGEGLRAAVENLLKRPRFREEERARRERFLRRQHGPRDGKASERVAALIEATGGEAWI